MHVLVIGSAGHLGEAMMRTLPHAGHRPTGIDLKPSAFTHHVGSITDRGFVSRCMQGVEAVIHTATLHKPHVVTHTHQEFIDTNVTGTLNVLEEARLVNVRAFVFTSTTSAFGSALAPPPGVPAAWITEDVRTVPKNIYGVTKVAAEDLCELFHRRYQIPCVILRTSRFFPEPDDRRDTREVYADLNVKANEFLYRRADIEDIVGAHLLALERAAVIGFDRYIVSATTPFTRDDLEDLRINAPSDVDRRVPRYREAYAVRGWSMFRSSTACISTNAPDASSDGVRNTTSPAFSIWWKRPGRLPARSPWRWDRRGIMPPCLRRGHTRSNDVIAARDYTDRAKIDVVTANTRCQMRSRARAAVK